MVTIRFQVGLALAAAAVLLTGCPKKQDKNTIRIEGSSTMVNVAHAWADEFHKLHPEVKISVQGGGSGIGITNLIQGTCDIANASRKMKPDEIDLAKSKRGGPPKEIVVGYDALAIYVSKKNPLDTISIEELAEIYKKDGKITKWSELGVKDPPGGKDEIVRVGRQNSSGTYEYFREVVLDNQDYRLGSLDQSEANEVVELVAHTPGAIGYSGMGYATDSVKMLKVSKKKGEPAIAPTLENAKSLAYPITRPLQIYTIGEPAGSVKEYLDWILTPSGQKIVLEQGYVPLGK